MLLKNKTAVITGCNRGIGIEILKTFSENGADIFACLRNIDDKFILLIDEIKKQFRNKIIPLEIDLSDQEKVKNCAKRILESNEPIDILVNNVGVSNRGTVEESKPEVFKRVFESNVLGSVNPTIPALPHLKKNKGSLIFISSLAGIRGLPNLGAYCSSKMALRAIAESIRIE